MGGAPGGFGGVTTEKCSPGRVWSGELAVWGDVRGGIEGGGGGGPPPPPAAGGRRERSSRVSAEPKRAAPCFSSCGNSGRGYCFSASARRLSASRCCSSASAVTSLPLSASHCSRRS